MAEGMTGFKIKHCPECLECEVRIYPSGEECFGIILYEDGHSVGTLTRPAQYHRTIIRSYIDHSNQQHSY